MEKRVLIIAGVAIALVAALCLGSLAGGGIVLAITQLRSGGEGQVLETGGMLASGLDPDRGVLVQSVDPDGPAGQAGVVRGDIILRIDGERVDRPRELMGLLAAREPGDRVTLEVLHGDEIRSVSVTLEDDGGLGLAVGGGGVGFGQPSVPFGSAGALIVEVLPGTPADEAGLETGMRVMAVDEQELGQEYDLADAIGQREPGDLVTLSVVTTAGENREFEVELGEHPDDAGRGYLGVSYQSLPGQDQPGFPPEFLPEDLPELPPDFEFDFLPGDDALSGAIVQEVFADTSAMEAGLAAGDVISAVDGDPVESPGDVVAAVRARAPGDELRLTILRIDSGEQEEVVVTLGENPEESGSAYLGVRLGGMLRFQGERNER